MEWKLADAQTNFFDIYKKSLEEGPQEINGASGSVVVLAKRDWQENQHPRQRSIVDFLRTAPDFTEHIEDFQRDKSPMREHSS